MGRRSKSLNPEDPLQAFAIDLKKLRDAAGPSGRLEATCEAVGITRSTYYAWLNGTQLPSRDLLEVTVKRWGGDVAKWSERRQQVENSLVGKFTPRYPRTVQPAPPTKKRLEESVVEGETLTRVLICFIEWVNAPVLPFPTTSILRNMLDEVLQGSEIRQLPVNRRDGNGESVLIFDLSAADQVFPKPSQSGARMVRTLLEDLDKLMSDFSAGKDFGVPYPQLRLFAHEGILTFDGSDYYGVPLETMESVRRGMPYQDALAGDFPGVIAIISGDVYRDEILSLSPNSFFGEWISGFTTDGVHGLRICYRVPRHLD